MKKGCKDKKRMATKEAFGQALNKNVKKSSSIKKKV